MKAEEEGTATVSALVYAIEMIENGIAARVGVPVEVGMAPYKGVAGEAGVAVDPT